MGGSERIRCPFPAALATFVVVIFGAAVLMVSVPRLAHAGMPLWGSVAATGVLAIVVEVSRRQINSCPWLDPGGGQRLVMYLLLFVIGTLVVFPAVWPTRDIEWVLRLPFLLFVIAGLAVLKVHLRIDHGDLEEAGVRRGVYFASRVPLYVLVTIGIVLSGVSILALVGVVR